MKRTGSLRLNAPYDWTKSATKAFMNATSASESGSLNNDEVDSTEIGGDEPSEIFKMDTGSTEGSEKPQRAIHVKLEEANKVRVNNLLTFLTVNNQSITVKHFYSFQNFDLEKSSKHIEYWCKFCKQNFLHNILKAEC